MRTVGGFEGLVLPETTVYAGREPLESRDTLADEDPCSGEYFADIPTASPADIDAVVAAAKRAFSDPSWRNMTPLQRERLLHAFADAIEADLPRLAALEALDTGKPVAIAETVDIPVCYAGTRLYVHRSIYDRVLHERNVVKI